MKVTISAYVLLCSYGGNITKLGVYETPAEAHFSLDLAVDKFIDEHYGIESENAECMTEGRYIVRVIDKEGDVDKAIFSVIEV